MYVCARVYAYTFLSLSFFLILSREKIRTSHVRYAWASEKEREREGERVREWGERKWSESWLESWKKNRTATTWSWIKEKRKGYGRRDTGMKMKDYSFSGCFLFGLQRRMQCRRGLRRKWCRGGTRRFIEPETQQHAEQHTTFRGDCTISALWIRETVGIGGQWHSRKSQLDL